MHQGVVVIGESSMGVTLAQQAASRGRRSTLCCLDPGSAVLLDRERRHWLFPDVPLLGTLAIVDGLTDCVKDAALVIVAVPSRRFRGVASALGRHVHAGQVLLSATKGFEPTSFERMSEVLQSTCGLGEVGAISGPNITSEIM